MFEEIPPDIAQVMPLDRRGIRRVQRVFNRYLGNGYDEQMGYHGDVRLNMIRGFGLHTFDDRFFFAKVTGRLDFIRKWVQLFIWRRFRALSESSIRLPPEVLRQIVGYPTILRK